MELAEPEEYRCLVIGPPKTMDARGIINQAGITRSSVRKLKQLIGRCIEPSEWQIVEFIPLENGPLAQVVCKTAAVCEQLQQIERLNVCRLPQQRASVEDTSSASSKEGPTLLQLNTDCLRRIVQLGTLKDQIVWAKVSRTLYEVVADFWRARYTTFRFDLSALECRQMLSSQEVTDFCCIVGPHVHTLIFNSVFSFPVIQKYLCDSQRHGNLMQKAKWFINVKLCEQLPHFPHVRVLEVQGKFMADFTLREVARYCRHLRILRLLDPDTRWLRATALRLFDQLEELDLQDCQNVSRRAVVYACRRNRLRRLYAVECLNLYRAENFERRLCPLLLHLSVLHVSAIANAGMLLAMLNLPALEELRFFWLNDFPFFEDLLFGLLRGHKPSQERLNCIGFHVERAHMDNESHEQLSASKRAFIREAVSHGAPMWQLEQKVWRSLACLGALRELHCLYCRPFNADSLFALIELCPSLRLIRLDGCRQPYDEELTGKWSQMVDVCELQIVGLIPLDELETKVRQRPRNSRAPVLRSITLSFLPSQ